MSDVEEQNKFVHALIGKDWDSDEVHRLAELTLQLWACGDLKNVSDEVLGFDPFIVFPPTKLEEHMAGVFEEYVREAVARFIADRIEAFNQGLDL